MPINTDLAWLAGIIDGEGCIYGHWVNRGRYATGGNVCVEIRVQATSWAMISTVAKICDEIGVRYKIEDNIWRPKSTKPSSRISIRRREDVCKFLLAVIPYLVVKKAEADAVVSWYDRWGDQRGLTLRATRDEKVVFFDSLRTMKKTA